MATTTRTAIDQAFWPAPTVGDPPPNIPRRDRQNAVLVSMLGDVESLEGAASASPAYRACTYIPFGDSRVANGAVDVGVSTIADGARAPHVQAQAMLGARLRQLRNAGIAGQTSGQMLARLQADVLDFAPGWCLMEGPVNDVARVVSEVLPPAAVLAELQTNIRAIHAACRSAGVRFAMSTLSPWTSSPVWTGAQRGLAAAMNRWIRDWGVENNVPIADVYETNTDPVSGNFVAGSAFDAAGHYSDYGGYLAARAWVKALDPVLTSRHGLVSFVGDYDSLIFDGSGSWALGGSLPASWTTSVSNVTGLAPSVVARTDGVLGSLMQITGTASAQAAWMMMSRASQDRINVARANSSGVALGARIVAGGNQYLVTTAGSTAAAPPAFAADIGATTTDGTAVLTRVENFAPGDTVVAEVEVFVSGVAGGNGGFLPQLIVQHIGGGGNLTVNSSIDQAVRVPPYPAGYYVLRSRPYVIAAGMTGITANVRVYLDNGVTGTLQVGRIRYRHQRAA